MKKRFIISLSLFVAQFAGAASAPSDVRLQYRQVPTSTVINATVLRVYNDGAVMKQVCKSGGQQEHCQPAQLVTKLDAYEMDRINQQIEEARDGQIQTSAPRAYCFVAPYFTNEYTADNGKVLLYSGHLCLTSRRNTTLAASRLVQTLERLRSQASSRSAAAN